MIRQAIDRHDRRNHTPGPTVGSQIRTGVVKDLMALVGEERRSRRQEPPIRIRGGVINISYGSGRAMQRQNPQNHRGRRRASSQQRSRRGGPSRPIGRREGGSVQRVVQAHVPKTATATGHAQNHPGRKSGDNRPKSGDRQTLGSGDGQTEVGRQTDLEVG